MCVYPELWKHLKGLGSVEATCGEHFAKVCNKMKDGGQAHQILDSDVPGAS